MRAGIKKSSMAIVTAAGLSLAIGLFCVSTLDQLKTITGSAQLVSVQEFGSMCLEPSGESDQAGEPSDNNLFSAFQEKPVYAAGQESGQTAEINRQPLRYLRDLDPIYSYVTVDNRRNEVFLQDANTWSIRIFNRLENTPGNAARSEAKRIIGGPKSDIQFNTCIYIDPFNGDIYTVENDVGNDVIVFNEDAEGDVAPIRKLTVTHRAYALAADETKQELYVSVQYPPQVEVYRKTATGNEKPLRIIRGESTRLNDVHGILVDSKNQVLIANNWGHISQYNVPGTGRFEAPSITVYRLDSDGDVSPLRVIQGPKTQLNWPGTMSLDPDTGDIYVGNDVGNDVLVFKETDRGDVAPSRIIKGDKTGLSSPAGVFVDTKNKELWVANIGNSSATVYPLGVNGNAAPIRTIRSAPKGKISLKFGKTQAVAYDSKREQMLVPN
jgi:6-phosphogluconolactonase (cycloisomerase 2 family)